MVARSYNASTWEAKARDREFKPSLGYTMRYYKKNQQVKPCIFFVHHCVHRCRNDSNNIIANADCHTGK